MRINILVWSASSLAILAILAGSMPVAAHLPIYDSGGSTMETAFEIPDADVSYAIFAEFSSNMNRIHFYEFSVDAGHLFNFQLTVPAIDGLRDFAPIVLLIGPGIAQPDGYTAELLDEFDVSLPAGVGTVPYLYGGTENVVEFEPFTQVNLWERQEAEVTLPNQGTYYLAVAVPVNTTHDASDGYGKYVLAPGKLEAFDVVDFILIPVDWVKTQVFWEHNVVLFMLPTIATTAVLTAGAFMYLRKRIPAWGDGLKRPIKVAFLLAAVGATMIVGAAVNQLLLVMSYTSLSPEGAAYIVILLQSLGLVLGALALLQSIRLIQPRSWANIIILVVVTLGALILGSGFIVGPVMFLAAGIAEMKLTRQNGNKVGSSGTT